MRTKLNQVNPIKLDDCFTKDNDLALMNGVQALVRLLIEQAKLDKKNGLVTIPTVSIPLSLANLAITEAPPVPVPPPMPAVINNMSQWSNFLDISPIDSSVAILPISGSEPVPNPLVNEIPNSILLAEQDLLRDWVSVFAEKKFTSSESDEIILSTALIPAPPIPKTDILGLQPNVFLTIFTKYFILYIRLH